MILHKFKYTLKILLKDRMLVFWTFAFPLLLGTFFMMAFADVEKGEVLDIIDIAIVDNAEFQSRNSYAEVFEQLSDPDHDDRLFDIVYCQENKAQKLLQEKKICGYLMIRDDQPVVTIGANGIDETIFSQVVDEIESQSVLFETIIQPQNLALYQFDYEKLYQDIHTYYSTEVTLHDRTKSNLSYTMIEFYSLIAMACLYGGLFVKKVLFHELANVSGLGKRNSIAPMTKLKMLCDSLLASYVVQLLGLALLYLYTIFVLNVDYGSHLVMIICLSLAGSLAGLALGVAVSCLCQQSENTKMVIMIAITMAGSFLSGMMGITMKYIVDTHFPVINMINPVSMITDGLYTLYYYDSFARYYYDLVSLLIFSAVLIMISVIKMRRMAYDRI